MKETNPGKPIAEMSTALLVQLAENMTGNVIRWTEMTPEERVRQSKPGMASPSTALNCLTLPLLVAFLKEIHRRGIETGWEWLVEMWDEESPYGERNMKSA